MHTNGIRRSIRTCVAGGLAIVTVVVGGPGVAAAGALPGSTVSGRLVDSSGLPVAGIPVTIRTQSSLTWPEAQGWPVSVEAVTGPDGSYHVTGIGPGSVYVEVADARVSDVDAVGRARADDATAVAVDGVAPVVFDDVTVLRNDASISGRVTGPGGQPAEGATVEVRVTPAPSGAGWEASYRHVTTDADGRYTATGLAPFTGTVTVTPPAGSGWAPQTYRNLVNPFLGTPIPLGEGVAVTALDIQLVDGAVVEGTVTGPDGTPVAGASVLVSAWSGSAEAVTDGLGRYRVAGLAADQFNVQANAFDQGLAGEGAAVTTASGVTAVVDLQLWHGERLHVTVVDELGRLAGPSHELEICRATPCTSDGSVRSAAVSGAWSGASTWLVEPGTFVIRGSSPAPDWSPSAWTTVRIGPGGASCTFHMDGGPASCTPDGAPPDDVPEAPAPWMLALAGAGVLLAGTRWRRGRPATERAGRG